MNTQVGRCLVLMGKHRSAVEVYEEALGAGGSDWEAWHNKGACYAQLGEADK
jgi:Bardet-Biedl syndrome 4 protein